MYTQALELIKKYDTIIIHRHASPDGDAIGSQVGLQQIILNNFPDKNVYIVGDDAGRYRFMEGWTPNEIPNEVYNGALAIVLDTSVAKMVSDGRFTAADATLRFDHHIFCEKFTDTEIIDTSFESCCGLVADFALNVGLKLNTLAAKSLFCGMVTDSGRFRYDSTNARTFRIAAELVSFGFDTNKMYADLYADDFDMIKLRASYVLKIRFSAGNVAYIITTNDELKKSGADEFTVSRGMVGVMSEIKGVDTWVNFTETDNGVLCELRSKKYNINPVAVKYGGGGHAKASGATVPNLETAMKMLADLDKLQA